MFVDGDEMDNSGFDGVDGYDDQDVEGDEVGSNRTLLGHLITAQSMEPPSRCKYRPDLICDGPLEEVFHLVTDTGFAYAYPKQFSTSPGSALTITMDEVIQNCGYASFDNPLRYYATYRFPNCTGFYHYNDDTCDYGCLATEYFHHFIASYNGEYPWKANGMCPSSQQRSDEWELCADAPDGNLTKSRQILQRGDPDGFALITDPAFKVPLKMPDGNYTPREYPPEITL